MKGLTDEAIALIARLNEERLDFTGKTNEMMDSANATMAEMDSELSQEKNLVNTSVTRLTDGANNAFARGLEVVKDNVAESGRRPSGAAS